MLGLMQPYGHVGQEPRYCGSGWAGELVWPDVKRTKSTCSTRTWKARIHLSMTRSLNYTLIDGQNSEVYQLGWQCARERILGECDTCNVHDISSECLAALVANRVARL